MLENIPLPLTIASVVIALTTIVLLVVALRGATHPGAARVAKLVALAAGLWTIVQMLLAFKGFYREFSVIPPRIFLTGVVPAMIAVFWAVYTKGNSDFIVSLPVETLTWLHTLRIPVEFGLYQLYLYHAVPQLMTFEGRNFDILAGLSAPLIAYLLHQKKIGDRVMMVWNLLALCLLLNIVINAIFATPLPLQRWGFEQPNVAIFYFPFILLPTVIVPIVLFAHLASLRALRARQ